MMHYRIIFYDLADKWEGELDSPSPLTCREAAGQVLAERGKDSGWLKGVIYRVGQDRLMPDSTLDDGVCLCVHRLLGGG